MEIILVILCLGINHTIYRHIDDVMYTQWREEICPNLFKLINYYVHLVYNEYQYLKLKEIVFKISIFVRDFTKPES